MPCVRGDVRALKAALAVCALPFLLGACASDDSFEGVRLGMTAEQVRASFQPGTWTTSMDEEGTVLLDWLPEQAGQVEQARFEFHQGLLVAIRTTLSTDHPQASDPSGFDDDVLRHVSTAGAQSVQVLWITRNCPIHRAEVEALLSTI